MTALRLPSATLVLAACLAIAIAVLPSRNAAAQTPALWTLHDADTTIYMFGTVHALPRDLGWLTDEIEQAFESADTLVLEHDVWDIDFEPYDDRGLYNDTGVSLSDLLTEEQQELLKQVAHDAIVPVGMLERYRPLRVAGVLGGAFGYHIGMRGPEGADNVFYDKAKKAKKRLAYLETFAATRYLLYPSAALEIELEILIQSLDRLFYDPRADERLINAWNAGDVEAIAAWDELNFVGLGAEAQAFLRGWDRQLLHDRNAGWVPQIEAMLKGSGTYFIAVGAAHFAGPDSVIRMLRNRNHVVDGPGIEPFALDYEPVRLPY